MSRTEEKIVRYSCDVCEEEIDTKGEPYIYHGKHFCEDCITAISERK